MSKPHSFLRRLCRDEDGSIFVLAAITIVVIFGFVGLALDGARFYMLNSDLQDMADAAAIAGAKELDGTSDAGTRAVSAAEAYFNSVACPYSNGSPSTGNCARWWDTSGAAISSVQLFAKLSDIPNNPLDPTTQGAQAYYIKVTTGTWGVAPTFISALGVTQSQSTAAAATAGSTYVACNVQPLMLCNPNETATSHPTFTATAGDLFGFTANGSTGGYSPGDFGLLDPPGQNNAGANQIATLLSESTPNFCYINTVSPDQGQKTLAVSDGINTRFDVEPNGNGNKTLDQTPAPNVIKGFVPNGNGKGAGCLQANQVKNLVATAEMPLATGQTQVGSTYVGGTFDSTSAGTYWTAHHDKTGATSWPSGVTRYGMYQGELAGTYSFTNGSSTEVQGPTCNTPAGDSSRRVVDVAVVNCLSQNITGNSKATVRATSYAEFFLVRPVGQDGIVWAEYIRTVTPTSAGSKLHQVIRLYNK